MHPVSMCASVHNVSICASSERSIFCSIQEYISREDGLLAEQEFSEHLQSRVLAFDLQLL